MIFFFRVHLIFRVLFGTTATTTTTSTDFKNLNLNARTRRSGTNTEITATGATAGVTRSDFVDTVLGGVDRARQAVTVTSFTNETNTKSRQSSFEWAIILKVNRVPANLDKGIAIVVSVGTSDIGRPVANGLILASPNAALLSTNARSVNIVVSSGADPIRRIRNGNDFRATRRNLSGNNHSFIAGKNCLTKRYYISTRIQGSGARSTVSTVVLFGKRLFNFAVFVAVKTAIH